MSDDVVGIFGSDCEGGDQTKVDGDGEKKLTSRLTTGAGGCRWTRGAVLYLTRVALSKWTSHELWNA